MPCGPRPRVPKREAVRALVRIELPSRPPSAWPGERQGRRDLEAPRWALPCGFSRHIVPVVPRRSPDVDGGWPVHTSVIRCDASDDRFEIVSRSAAVALLAPLVSCTLVTSLDGLPSPSVARGCHGRKRVRRARDARRQCRRRQARPARHRPTRACRIVRRSRGQPHRVLATRR